ncbi:ankyrin repeat domain-containing protein [Bacteroidota bacterium]
METKIIKSLIIFTLCLAISCEVSENIHDTVKNGNKNKLDRILKKNPALINATDNHSRTALHLASDCDNIEIAAFLIEKGAEIDAKDLNSKTPLHYAAMKDKVSLAELLLEEGANINAQDKDDFAPIHWAAMNNQPNIMKYLIDNGAKIDIKEYRGATPLLMCIWRMGNYELTKLLIEKGAEINLKQEGSWVTPLAMAAQYGHREIIDLLLDNGAEVDETSYLLLRFSVDKGLDRLFKVLYNKGASLDVRTNNGGTLMHYAAEGGSFEIINTLIKKGFSYKETDRYGWLPIHYACLNGKKDAVECFINNGADLNSRIISGKSAYNIAVERGHKNIIQLLLLNKADTTKQNFPVLNGKYLGQTPPGENPEIFALGIISTPDGEHGNICFSPDGNTFYWTTENKISVHEGYFRIFNMFRENDQWTKPSKALISNNLEYTYDVPFVSPDGNRMFFMSKRPVKPGDTENGENYWYIDKTETGWTEPVLLNEEVSSKTIRWQISASMSGNIYFGSTDAGGKGGSDIYFSSLKNGKYTIPENIGEPVNTESSETAPFIAPDESYIIFSREGQPQRYSELYISFRKDNGSWSDAINMGEEINLYGANCPYITPDGKYLFFKSGRNGNFDVYWVSTSIIDKLKRMMN